VGKARPAPSEWASAGPLRTSSTWQSVLATVAFLLVVCGAGAALFVFREKLFKSASAPPLANPSARMAVHAPPRTIYPVPTNFTWTLDLTNAVTPDSTVAGSIHGNGFQSERATLTGGTLTFRQGKGKSADLALSVHLFARQGEELSGQNISITPERPPQVRVALRWRNEEDKTVNKDFKGGYALKVEFGRASNGRMPGKIYLCLPDDSKSFVAGTFDAEIKKPAPPKPRPEGKGPKPPAKVQNSPKP
jgi:hypothetical protein